MRASKAIDAFWQGRWDRKRSLGKQNDRRFYNAPKGHEDAYFLGWLWEERENELHRKSAR